MNHQKPKAGFTLLELLVVMVIIAIVITFAVLAIGDAGKSRRAKYFTENLTNLMHLAEQYAILQPTTIQLHIKHNQLSFKEYRMIAGDDGSLRYRLEHIQTPLFKTLKADHFIRLKSSSNKIQFYSNGTVTPFSLDVRIPGERLHYKIIGQRSGTLIMKEENRS